MKKRVCKCCSALIESYNVWLCDACQAAGLGAGIVPGTTKKQELLQIAREREGTKTDPLAGMTLDEIALLARCFLPPYATYGGLRGYVAGHGCVPPKSLERRET